MQNSNQARSKNPNLQRADISFEFRNNHYKGSIVAPPAYTEPCPLILIFHNFQGLKIFDIDVAEYMAEIGYVGLAADLYGDIVPPDQRL